MTYRYRVLGATQALRPDGTDVPLSGTRLRALLTALAAAGGRGTSTGRLIAQVWPLAEAAPADETAALQALVGRARRALGGDAVASLPGGYRLAAERDDIDLFRFERLADAGAAALTGGDPDQAAALLDEALALWDGRALADLPGGDTDPRAVHAERRREEARRARLAAEVGRGRADRALPGLAALAAGHPLDEPLHALRIRALRAAGRPAEALQAYEEVRTRLAERLGTDPGRDLRALHAELLAGDDGPSPAGPAPGPAGRAARGNLPARLTSFVGRAPELAALAAELPVRRLITLTGPGGSGKTRLSVEAAEAAADAWPDGVWLVELAPVHDAAVVPETVLTALRARDPLGGSVGGPAAGEPAPPDPLGELADHCARRRLLIVLDNCEHLLDAAATLAETVLTGCPGVSVLATSREPLGVRGESVRTVEPLPADMALRLLAERGAAARPGFRTEDDPDACAEICRRLDGLPLALELAAARLRMLTPRGLADRLDDRFRLLGPGSGPRTALPRQRTLRAVVDWSWDLLTEAEQAVLRGLSVFSGGCALAEAETVCGPDADGDILGVLASLVDKSLLVAVPADPGVRGAPDGMRYRLLETVAEYAAERLEAAGERAAVELRHLAAYRELARVGDPGLRGPRTAFWLACYEREHDNLRAALRTAVDRREEQEALCLVLSMSWFWQVRNHRGEAGVRAAAALGPDPFRAPVRPAVPLAEPCTALAPPWPPEVLWEARRGVRLLLLWTAEEESAYSQQPGGGSRLHAITEAYRPGLPQICRQPGSLWFFLRLMTGQASGLRETLDALVLACREQRHGSGGDWDLGLALMQRARLLGGGVDGPARSARDADEALALFRRAGDLVAISEALSVRGETHARQGRFEEAAADFEQAMESCARVGASGQVPLFKARLASVRLESAADPAARARAERLLLEAAGRPGEGTGQAVGMARLLLARHYESTGRLSAAREQLDLLEREIDLARQPLLGGTVAGVHSRLDCRSGEFARAGARSAEAVRTLESLAPVVAPHLMVQQFPCAAWAKAALGAPEDAARLLGAYAHHHERPEGFEFDPFTSPADPELLDRAETAVRAALDERSYAHAHAEGAALRVEEAAALV
ncbi:BTAD domain-containing putative transcriptional regulator [Streptomyces sp. NPDC059255]|uniref:AfsR/SARP family transcriptional regulator n=1 Tax=Streptomyces sp. NPDC059255 TaxID=3346793 RepID=UPI003681F750